MCSRNRGDALTVPISAMAGRFQLIFRLEKISSYESETVGTHRACDVIGH